MKHGLILTGSATREKDKKAVAARLSAWKLVKFGNESFFVTDQTFEAKFLMERLKVSVMNGLKVCEEAGMMHSYIFDYNISIPAPNALMDLKNLNRLTCLSFQNKEVRKVTIRTKQLDYSFMFGKTKTLKQLWGEMPLNNADIRRSIFKGVTNLAGCSLELASIVTPDELGIKRRIV